MLRLAESLFAHGARSLSFDINRYQKKTAQLRITSPMLEDAVFALRFLASSLLALNLRIRFSSQQANGARNNWATVRFDFCHRLIDRSRNESRPPLSNISSPKRGKENGRDFVVCYAHAMFHRGPRILFPFIALTQYDVRGFRARQGKEYRDDRWYN